MKTGACLGGVALLVGGSAVPMLSASGGPQEGHPVVSRATSEPTSRTTVLRIGSISPDPDREIRKFLPWATYLAGALRPSGILEGKVVVAKDIPRMAAWLREGKVDLYVDSLYPSLAVRRISGTRILCRRWKKGLAEYRSVLFARADSGLRSLEDLRGKTIGLEDPFSTTGYFLPKVRLLEKGLRPIERREPSAEASAEDVGYVFTHDEENTLLWVLRGRVAAGAMDDQSLRQKAGEDFNRLVVLDETSPVPRHLVSARGDLPEALVASIRAVLLGMERTEEGRRALDDFEQTTRFDPLPERDLERLLATERLFDAVNGPP